MSSGSPGELAGVGGSGGEASTPDGFWTPTGDPGWAAVGWAPDCSIEAAGKPELAMPALTWKPCAGLAGCERFDPNWYVKNQIYLGFAAGYRNAQGSLLGIGTAWGDGTEWRSAVYGADGKPIAVWRGKSDDCNGVSPRPQPEHVCIRAAKLGGGARGGFLPLDDLATPTTTFETRGRLSMSCSQDLSVGFDASGTSYIYDLGSSRETPLTLPSGTPLQAEAFGSTAYLSRSYRDAKQHEGLDGWVWTPDAGPKPLIDPGGKFVADLRSDGTSLLWLELDMTTLDHAATGKLWMSPIADTPENVQRHFVREVPSASITAFQKVAGGGFYAMIEQHDDPNILGVHVFRLRDGRHWSVPLPPDLIPGTLVWIDAEELLIATALPSGASHGLMRQRLAELGAGD